MTTRWAEQLNSVQDKHGENISKIQVQAEKCLVKDYMVEPPSLLYENFWIRYTFEIYGKSETIYPHRFMS